MCVLSHTVKMLHLFRRSKHCLVVTTILNKQTIRNKTKPNNNMFPARSPDRDPLYFFLWEHLKTLVYATPVVHVDVLLQRIVDGCNTIRTTPDLLERVRQSMLLRCQLCLQEGSVTSKLFCNAEMSKGYCLFWFCFLLFVCSEWLLQLNNACYDETSVAS